MSQVKEEQPRDILDCVICLETYDDPRLLPCLHTYCLKCIEGWSQDKQPADEMQCPLCKRVFSIPDTGVRGLPKNVIIERLKSLKETTSPAAGGGSTSPSVALQQQLCEKHSDESLRLYCLDCNLAICTLCLTDQDHSGHKFMNSNTVVDQFQGELIEDIGRLVEGSGACQDILQRAVDMKNELGKHLSKIETEICETADELKQTVDRHKDILISELSAMKQRRLEEIEDVCNEIRGRQSMIQNYKQYAAELTCDKNIGSGIAQLAQFLHQQTQQLLNFDAILQSDNSTSTKSMSEIKFIAADALGDGSDVENIVGKLGEDPKPFSATLVHVFQKGNPIGGVTSLGNQLFVVRKKCKELVEIYDTSTFKLKRHMRVLGLGSTPYALTSCVTNNCLYIADHYVVNDDIIYRVELSDTGDKISKWPGIRAVEGLCVNIKHNVLVTCFRSINEYSTHGVLIRQIDSGSVHLCHAIQLTNSRFAVSSRIKNSVFIMASDGRIIHSHLPRRLLGFPANQPCHMAIDSHGWILVADILANQITMLNQSLSVTRELPLSSLDGGLKEPWTLCFDKSRDRLYIGEWDGGRVLVFDCKQ